MATRILPHNFREVLEAQILLLGGRETKLLPDFPTGGIVDVSEYDDGRGRLRVRARIEATDEHTIVIREIPFTTTTENLIASIEAAAQKGKVQLREISDYTTEKVEIEIGLPRGVTAAESFRSSSPTPTASDGQLQHRGHQRPPAGRLSVKGFHASSPTTPIRSGATPQESPSLSTAATA
jgi:hypothetical protein